MPENSPKSVPDRVAKGTRSNVHPVGMDGNLAPTPEDIMQRRGDFVKKDAAGNPEGLKIVRVENPDAWDVLIGGSSAVTRQNSAPLLLTRPSFVQDRALVNGPPPPSPRDPLLARIPKPQTPLLKVVKAEIHGYPQTTPEKPMWYGYCWIKNDNLTLLGPVVPFELGQGQGVSVGWDDPPPDADGVALFLSEPGTSSDTNPGPMREQRRLLFSSYKLKTYPLSGPYRNGRLAPTQNETMLPAPVGNYVTVEQGGNLVAGDYHFYVGVATALGETLATPSNHIQVLGGVEFPILSGAHDHHVWRLGSNSWPPDSMTQFNGGAAFANAGKVGAPPTEFTLGVYERYVACFKWNTDTLPEDVTIISAFFRFHTRQVDNPANETLYGEFFEFEGGPQDYAGTINNSAISYPVSSIVANQVNDVPILPAALTSINKGGDTGLRVSFSNATPAAATYGGDDYSGREVVYISTFESGHPVPKLVVIYAATESVADLQVPAGSGHFVISRPPLPPGATGWFSYAQKNDGVGQDVTGRLFFRKSGGGHGTYEGRDFALGSSISNLSWSGDLVEGRDPYGVELSSDSLPTENTTGIEPPDSEPDPPIAFGAVRPIAGRKYVRIVERVGNRRSVASDLATINTAFDELLRVIHRDHTNLLANGDYIELDANSLPLDHTIVTTGGAVRVEGRELVLETLASQTGVTPSDTFDPVPVNKAAAHAVWGYLKVREPRAVGVLAGTAEVVLRELDSANVATDTVLYAYTQVGEYEYHKTISPTGTTGSGVVAWRSDTVTAGVIIRLSGSNKHMHIRSSRVVLKDHIHKFLWEGEPPDTELHRPPGTQNQVALPPNVAPPPQTWAFPAPDRPKLSGVVRESVDFEPGMPAGWAQNITGGATLVRSAAAALVGSWGLQIKDITTTLVSGGYLSKTFDANGTSAMGFSTKMRPSILPAGKLILGGLARPSDGQLFAWLETGSLVEISKLVIDSSPTTPGTFTVIPDGALAAVSVVATKQVEELSITGAPTASGTITLSVGGERTLVNVGRSQEIARLTLQAPRASDYLTVNLGGVDHNVQVDVTDTPEDAARKVAQALDDPVSGSGWRAEWRPASSTGLGGNVVTFTSLSYGPQPDATYNRGPSGTPGTIVTTQQGAAETPSELANRIAAAKFPLRKITHTPGSTSITFIALRAGPQPAPTIDWGPTGGTGTISTTTPGVVDTPSQLAARIRAATLTGWTLSGSGTEVFFTANAAGWKRDLRINPGPTGVLYTTEQTQQGKAADLSAHYKDDSGATYSRLIMSGLSPSTIYNAEIAVQGAGTKSAVITAWGSIGAAAKDHLWRVPNIKLASYLAGVVRAGVSAEATASETWEVHVDNIKVTDKGEAYFEEYNDLGELVGQFHHYGIPTQPVRQDIGIQEWYEPCIPGQQYAIAARIRHDNVPASKPAKPVFITAHFEDGSVKNIGDVTGSGISGTGDWYEPTWLVTPPAKCYALGFSSRDLSSGEIVVQRVVMSPGSTAKRTGLYAPSGIYTTTLESTTPNQPSNTYWGSVRRSLDTLVVRPLGTSYSVRHRVAKTQAELALATWYSNPSLMPSGLVVEIEVTLTSNGVLAPILVSGSPSVFYELILRSLPVSTFLREDRTEFDGGAVFMETPLGDEVPEVGMSILEGKRLRPQVVSDDAPTLPESGLYVFSDATRREIVNNYYKPHAVEANGEIFTVRLAGKPVFKEIGRPYLVDGKRWSVWVGSLSWAEVIRREPL